MIYFRNIKRIFCFVTHMIFRVHVGQAVQAEDVALLPVLVDLGEGQPCGIQSKGVLTRAFLDAVVLYRCTVGVHAPQRQQQRQQHAVLHG